MPRAAPRIPVHRGGRPGCFGCDPSLAAGLRLRFRAERGAPPGTLLARCRLRLEHMGPPGIAHGGIVATLLDEAMTKVAAHAGVFALTRELTVTFEAPTRLGVPLAVRGSLRSVKGRVRLHEATLHDAKGTLLARATATFIVPRPELLARIAAAQR